MKKQIQITVLIIGIMVAVSCLYTIISEKVSFQSTDTLSQRIRAEVTLKSKTFADLNYNTIKIWN